MARPRKAQEELKATVKIEGAFWRLLETQSFSEITVRLISQESGTNRNSFYYHYTDINDLAYKAFRNNANKEVTETLIPALLSALEGYDRIEVSELDPSILMHSGRIMLCAGSDSPYLRQLVEELLKDIWFDALGIREDLLSESEKLQVGFIFAGLVATLGSREVRESPLQMLMLAQTEIGRTILSTLKGIAAK